MSFVGYKEKIQSGDTVILQLGFGNMLTFVVKPGETHQTKYGALRHSDLIGVRYGSRVQCPRGWLYVLHPTPELWTVNLPHRTQILYTPDISLVTLRLDLRPGSVVVESGTGSASLSHALIRTIQPTGHLHTFEFHEERAVIAKDEFSEHGLSDHVTVSHRDVCEEGFGLNHVADAVFLDLPRPWLAMESARLALKRDGGRLCSFSPCIEQVQRSCLELSQLGFHDISTVECLQRGFDVKSIDLRLPNLGFDKSQIGPTLAGGLKSGTEVKDDSDVDKESDNKAAEDNASTLSDSESNDGCLVGGKKAKLDCSLQGDNSVCLEEKSLGDMTADSLESHEGSEKCTNKQKISSPGKSKKSREYYLGLIGNRDEDSFSFRSTVPHKLIAGHTGFLTFATLYPDDV